MRGPRDRGESDTANNCSPSVRVRVADADGVRAGAVDLGDITANTQSLAQIGHVGNGAGYGDFVDYFRFSLSAGMQVELTLTPVRGVVTPELALEDGTGGVLHRRSTVRAEPLRIVETLQAGTWYVRVADESASPKTYILGYAVAAAPAPQPREVSIEAGGATTTTRSITPGSETVTEGAAAVFTLTRTGPLAEALTVNVEVSETGAMLKGTPPATVTFDAGSATAELSVATEDDEVAEPASVVTAALEAGSGYAMDAGASSAAVTVADDDAAPVIASTGPFTVEENETAVATLAASDDDTPVADLAWSMAGGADAAAFTLGTGGVLAFAAAKDFEAPDDAGGDGDYEVTVRVTDEANTVEATLTIRLTDVEEVAPPPGACPADHDWCAIMTVGKEYFDGGITLYGYDGGSTFGDLDDASIAYGEGYTVESIRFYAVHGISGNGAILYTFTIDLDAYVPHGTVRLRALRRPLDGDALGGARAHRYGARDCPRGPAQREIGIHIDEWRHDPNAHR